MSVAEPANTTYPVKFREKATGFAIMASRNTMRWEQSIRICAMIGVGEMNEQLSLFDYMQSIQPKEPKNIFFLSEIKSDVLFLESAGLQQLQGLKDCRIIRFIEPTSTGAIHIKRVLKMFLN